MKHAQKVTKSAPAGRPVLKGVCHAPDGSLYVTDSYRLYAAKHMHSNVETSVVDPKTGGTIDGSYPDVSRLIPNRADAKYIARLNVEEALGAFNALLKANQVVGKGEERVEVRPIDEGTKIAFVAENRAMTASYEVPTQEGEIDGLTFNTTFMVDALRLFKDAGVTNAELRFYGDLRPFTITDGSLLALILPIRVPRGDD